MHYDAGPWTDTDVDMGNYELSAIDILKIQKYMIKRGAMTAERIFPNHHRVNYYDLIQEWRKLGPNNCRTEAIGLIITMVRTVIDGKEIYVMEDNHGTAA